MSTSGHVQYIRGYHYECGGIPCVHRRNTISTLGEMFSTLGDIMMHVGGYHEYIEGCSAHQRDLMMHLVEQLDKSFQFLLKTPVYS